MTWDMLYTTSTGDAVSLYSGTPVTPGAGQTTTQVSATNDRPTGIWNTSTTSFDPLPDVTLFTSAFFRNRFTLQEMLDWTELAIEHNEGDYTSAAINARSLFYYVMMGGTVDVTDTEVDTCVNDLETQGVLGSGRAAIILATVPPVMP